MSKNLQTDKNFASDLIRPTYGHLVRVYVTKLINNTNFFNPVTEEQLNLLGTESQQACHLVHFRNFALGWKTIGRRLIVLHPKQNNAKKEKELKLNVSDCVAQKNAVH